MIEEAGAMAENATFMAAGGIVSVIGQMAWRRFFSSEGKALTELYKQLGERLSSQEERIRTLEARLHEEFSKRLVAEEKMNRLRMRVYKLETEMRHHGIEVPPHEEHARDDGH